ncbi:MAG: hypothetical protein ACI8XO_000292 [Verrucomicrobiales bacterium]|jgi:hypothetical protein
MMVLADYTDRGNWVIGEFLIKEIKKPNIPVNLFISGDPSKEPILMNGPITQNSYIDAINKVGGK